MADETDFIPFDEIYPNLLKEFPKWIDTAKSGNDLVVNLRYCAFAMNTGYFGNIVLRKADKPAHNGKGRVNKWYEQEETKWIQVLDHVAELGYEPRDKPYQFRHWREHGNDAQPINEANALFDIQIGTCKLTQIVNGHQKLLKKNDQYSDRIFLTYRPMHPNGDRKRE